MGEGRGHHKDGKGGKLHKVLKVAASPEFISLVEARSR
jgi:hypothetical protein